jgi:hypothetical protein
MSTKRVLLVLVVASVVVLAIAIGSGPAGTAQALPQPAQANQESVTIPYAGALSAQAGQPVSDGLYDFSFALYGAETGGELLWSEVQGGITVRDGTFEVALGSAAMIPPALLDDGLRWLEVGVRGPGELGFTQLLPRQRLVPALAAAPDSPAAGAACPHDHVGEVWSANVSWSNGAIKVLNYNNGPSIWGWNGGGGNGLRGYATGGGLGVYGESQNNAGVAGRSTTGDGVVGEAQASNKSGVFALNTGSGYGLTGQSANGWGVNAVGKEPPGPAGNADRLGDLVLGGSLGEVFAFGDMGLYTDGDAYVDLDDNDDNANAKFVIFDGKNGFRMTVHENGDLWAAGTKSALVETADQGQRLMYALESSGVWFEDFGFASLVDGERKVAFEPVFASTVNLGVDYHVFLTPLCQEPVLLFVTAKDATSFTVQGVTLDGKAADCAFDYRIVAKRLGYEDLRMERVTAPTRDGSQ